MAMPLPQRSASVIAGDHLMVSLFLSETDPTAYAWHGLLEADVGYPAVGPLYQDDVAATLEYAACIGIPIKIVVIGTGTVLRQREATFSPAVTTAVEQRKLLSGLDLALSKTFDGVVQAVFTQSLGQQSRFYKGMRGGR
jgi:hypothetical protein